MFSNFVKCYNKSQAGYITLMSVLVVGAVGGAVTVSLILLGLGSSRTSFALERSGEAKAIANACAEEALEQIREAPLFTGSGNLTIGLGECVYTVASGGDENRTISASGSVGSYVRKVRIVIEKISPKIQIASWQEVPDL